MSRRLTIGIVVAVIAIGLIGLLARGLRSSGSLSPTPTPASQVILEEPAVTAEGVIVPVIQTSLSFRTSGTLQKLAVREGETVEAGQLLAQLEATDLEMAVRRAEDSLALNQALLTQTKASPRPEEIAAAQAGLAAAQAGVKQAQAALASAQSNLDKLLAGPTELELELARQEVDQARDQLWAAQAERDGVKGNRANPGYLVDAAEAAVLQAEIGVRMAELRYEQLKAGPGQEEIAAARAQVQQAQGGLEAAQAQVEQAQAQLEQLKAGPRPEDVAVAEARVRQAETALEEARLALEKTRLIAPFAGTVVEIGAREGESVVTNVPIITLADLSRLQVETTDLDEWGAAKVRVGQRAEVTVNAFDDKVLTGTVVSIASRGKELPTGEVAFTVTIALDEQDPELRWGMTVKVVFSP
ncbi:MAG: HlyD family secretion protein [Anaerolineae bacterium]